MEEQRLILVNVAGDPGFNRSGYSLTFTASIFKILTSENLFQSFWNYPRLGFIIIR